MFNHLLLKFSLFFLAGVIVTLFLLQYIPTKQKSTRILGEQTTTLDDVLHERSWGTVNALAQSVLEKVLPSLYQNPAFEPVLKTKADIESTSEEIKNLPKDQRSAICKEICPLK